MTSGLYRACDASISVGATLKVGWPAFSLIQGRYGFADLGNLMNKQGAYLGDYQYEKGEQLGDVALVAAAYYGKGKVLVFGDTSSFQNGALPFSFVPFVYPIFDWLAARDWPGIGLMKLVAGLAVLLAAAWLVRAVHGVWVPLPGGVMILAFWSGWAVNQRQMPPPRLNCALALIDRTHLNRISLTPMQTDSIGPLILNLLRNGFLPLATEHWPAEFLREAKVLVVTAPTRTFAQTEMRDMTDFVASGGFVVMNSGWEEKGSAMQALLDQFGLDILNIPMGPFPVVRTERHLAHQAQFINAWPVVVTDPKAQDEFENARRKYRPAALDTAQAQRLNDLVANLMGGREEAALPAISTSNSATNAEQGQTLEVLYQTDERLPLVLARRIGRGAVVLIGDSYFLASDNLDNLQYYREGNILFLRHVFDRLKGKRG